MSNNENITVIALGGSIIVSRKIQTDYLKRLRKFIVEEISKGKKFIIVAGGGSTARNYQKAAETVVDIEDEDKDWLGIHSTRLNAHLLRTIFYDYAYPFVLDNPEKPIKERDFQKYALFIASGWRPGWSTDYIAFRMAHRFNADKVVIATKIPYVYDKDISLHTDASHFEQMTWKEYQNLLPKNDWVPGMKSPVDPIATRFAIENGIKCVLLRGTNIRNLQSYFKGGDFKGTIIE